MFLVIPYNMCLVTLDILESSPYLVVDGVVGVGKIKDDRAVRTLLEEN